MSKSLDYADRIGLAKALMLKVRALNRPVPAWSVEERNRFHLPFLRCLAALVDAGALHPIFQTDVKGSVATGSLAYHLVSSLSTLIASPRLAKQVSKTCAAADSLLAVLSATAATSPLLANLSLAALVRSLTSPFPRIRAYVAEQLYTRLIELSIVNECFLDTEKLSLAQVLLGNAAWGVSTCMFHLEDTVSQLTQALVINNDDVDIQKPARRTPQRSDELDSYTCLVRDAGY